MSAFSDLFASPALPISAVTLKNASEYERNPSKPKNEVSYIRSDLTSAAEVAEAFRRHEAGEQAISLSPIQKTKDREYACTWAALDFDDYEAFDTGKISTSAIISSISAHLPTIGVETKSGGLHCLFFFAEPIAASLVRAALNNIKSSLTFDKIEVFPKSDTTSESGFGSALSLPYFGASSGSCRRVSRNERGLALSREQFVELCLKSKITLERLSEIATAGLLERPMSNSTGAPQPQLRAQASAGARARLKPVWEALRGPNGAYTGPPCLPTMLIAGVSSSRNDLFYSMSVYLRQAWMSDPNGREIAEERALTLYDLSFERMSGGDAFEKYEARAAFSSAWKSATGYRCDIIQGLTFDGVQACDNKKIKRRCMMRKHGLNIGEYADLREMFESFRIVTDGARSHALFVVAADPRKIVTTIPCESLYLFDIFKQSILKRCAISVSIDRTLIRDGTWEWFTEDLINNCEDRIIVDSADYEAGLKTALRSLFERSSVPWRSRGADHSPELAVVSENGLNLYFTRHAVERIISTCSASVVELFRSGILSAALSQVCDKEKVQVTYTSGESVLMYSVDIRKSGIASSTSMPIRTLERPENTSPSVNHFEEELKRMAGKT